MARQPSEFPLRVSPRIVERSDMYCGVTGVERIVCNWYAHERPGRHGGADLPYVLLKLIGARCGRR